MDRALGHAPGGVDVWLDVWEENLGAQRLYERNGFAKVGRVKLETASGAGAGHDFIMVRRAGG
jgi:ribosomal protein S18 acetylase RimI-like enzyme